MGDVIKIRKGSHPESYRPPESLAKELSELSRRIVELCGVTEDHFLSLGLKIQEYSDKASMVTSSTLTASRIISGDDLKSATEGLVGMVDQLSDIFNRVDAVSDENLGSLLSIGRTVKAVERELVGLEDTSRDLKMLALSTKIQSTKTGGGSSAFMQLGEDIARMSATISTKTRDLLEQTGNLSDFVQNVEINLHNLKDKQRYQTESVLKWTRGIIESISAQSARSKKEATKLKFSTEKISRSVADMVTSVQYQDITKQSLEKVIDGLKHIQEVPCPENSSGSDQPFELSILSSEIILTGNFIRQMRRLEKTEVLVQEALDGMVHSLEDIAASINSMTVLTSVVNNDSARFLVDLETAMSSVTSFLREVVQSNRAMSNSMRSLGHTVENMSEFTQDIEMMSSEVELISLNARIMAAQAGAGGAGMGVIADAVKETASTSEDQRVSVVGRLNEISMTSVQLKSEMDGVTRGDEDKLDQLVRELGVFLDALQTMQKKILSMLCDIDNHSSELVNAIKSSVAHIRGHHHLVSESADIATRIKQLAQNCCQAIELADLSVIAGNGSSEDELIKMELHQRLGMVEAFFSQHFPGVHSEELYHQNGDDGDIVLFDREI